MKSIKLSVFFVILFFAGCSKEEENTDTVRLISSIDYYQNSGMVELKKISKQADVGETSFNNRVELRYDEQNRIVEITYTYADNNYPNCTESITYPEKNTITVSLLPPYSGKTSYVLNSEGYVESWSDIFRLRGSCIYDDGYLQKTEYYGDYYVPEEYFTDRNLPAEWASTAWDGTETISYSWEDGNIKTMTDEISVGNYWERTATTTFEYSSVKFVQYNMDFGISDLLPRGKSLRNMPSRITIKKDNQSYVIVYRYETDEYGYPVRIYIREDGNETLLAAIEYKD